MAGKRWSLSFLERSQRVIGTVALILIVAGTAFALLLQGGMLTRTYRVTAMFTDAAGMRPGDYVTVAGLQAGTVKDVRIEEGRVAMELGVHTDVELTADSRAEIVIETLLGRRSVALVTGSSEKPLEDGAVIPPERTTTPIDITELNDISVDLLEASDAQAFDTFLSDVADITEGKARDIRTLVDGLDRVLLAVDSRKVELTGLLRSLRILSGTLAERDQTIVSLIDNLEVVLANLAARQDDIETLLLSTDSASHETADLVRRNRAVLDSTLRHLHTDLQVIDRHQLDIAAGISYLENAVQGYSTVGYSQGIPNRWANIFVQSLGPAGVDALIGPCGTVDQFFDDLFGTNCQDPNEPPGSLSSPSGTPVAPPETPSGGAPEEGMPATPTPGAEQEVPGLPCSIGDVVDDVLDGTGAEPTTTGRCP
jgi:phospholipid/cholesterol/gamma-HCH transport system substrate-binding protein